MTPLYYLVLVITLQSGEKQPHIIGAYSSESECIDVSGTHSSETFCTANIQPETLQEKVKISGKR
jgi:hypothetical protein